MEMVVKAAEAYDCNFFFSFLFLFLVLFYPFFKIPQLFGVAVLSL